MSRLLFAILLMEVQVSSIVTAVMTNRRNVNSQRTHSGLATDRFTVGDSDPNIISMETASNPDSSVPVEYVYRPMNYDITANESNGMVSTSMAEIGPKCDLYVNNTSALYFKTAVDVWKPHLVRFKLRFNESIKVEYSSEVIQPAKWTWTFYDPDGFFPYLKWPVDFSLLSFGLLNSKTYHQSNLYLYIETNTENCSLKLGNRSTTLAIGNALRDFTRDFLVHMDQSYSYSYWCYLSEVPGVKKTTQYTLAIYFDFPVEFNRYNCCRTANSRLNQSKLNIHCLDYQITKMFEVTVIPYLIGLIAYAYFPYLLISSAKSLYEIKHHATPKCRKSEERNILTDNGSEETDTEWVFLNEHPPIYFMQLVAGLCGLMKRHPIATSRIRRIVFVVACPVLIYVQIYMYYKYEYKLTKALIDHGMPMGYLTLLGGAHASKTLFSPQFGGPCSLLMTFYIGGLFFVILPSRLDTIFGCGGERTGTLANVSPLFYSSKQIEKLSLVSLTGNNGYSKISALFKAGICMLMNPRFWKSTVCYQFERFKRVFGQCPAWCRVILVACIPLYLVVCILELVFCILYYGVPLVTFIAVVTKGYRKTFVRYIDETRSCVLRPIGKLAGNRFFMTCLSTFLTAMFVFYVFSFCTVFVACLAFVSEVVVLTLMAVIVYPSYAFGYLFFGIVLIYYILKQLQGFGEGYKELLADAVEVCQQLEDQSASTYVHDDTLVISSLHGADISKIQIANHVINLPINQVLQIHHMQEQEKPKVIFRSHTAGIPRGLFRQLVHEFRPVHIQLSKVALKTFLIMALIAITTSILMKVPNGQGQSMSEVMHVVFVVVIGVLPRMLEVALGTSNEMVAKEIKLRKIKARIIRYWSDEHELA